MNLSSRVLWGLLCASILGFLANFVVAAEGDVSAGARHADTTERCRCVGDARGEAAVRINQALGSPIISAGMEYTDQPLEEVVSTLQDDYDIPIQLDLPALDNHGLGPDEPITVSLRNVSLKSALRLMLRQHDLTYVIREEVLMITTPEKAAAELRACVYDVRDLITNWEDQAGLEALTRAIMSSVATQTWKTNGGEAQISPLRPGLLVITQTRACHEEIAELLEVVREMQAG